MNDPSKYCSIIVDGDDQSEFCLPHFCTSTKDTLGHSLKVRLVGVLDHVISRNKLSLFTMTEEYETGANHFIEGINSFVNDRVKICPLPCTLYI